MSLVLRMVLRAVTCAISPVSVSWVSVVYSEDSDTCRPKPTGLNIDCLRSYCSFSSNTSATEESSELK